MTLVWTSLSLMLTRCFQVYSQAQAEKSAAQQLMSAQLYDRMQNSQEGVVTAIMDEMSDQQLKQMLMAYALLVVKQRPVTTDELDEACEEMLARDFDHRIDFQIEDALPRLEAWGLVTRVPVVGAGQAARGGGGGGGGVGGLLGGAVSFAAGTKPPAPASAAPPPGAAFKLEALPMDTAIAVLSTAWASAYEALGNASGADGADIPTVDLITGAASSFATRISAAREELGRQAAAEQQAAAGAGSGGKFGRMMAGAGVGKRAPSASSGPPPLAAPTLATSPTPREAAAPPPSGLATAARQAPAPSPGPTPPKKGFGKFMDKLRS